MAQTVDKKAQLKEFALGLFGVSPDRLARSGLGGPGGGAVTCWPKMRPWRATTNQVCGLYPFSVGSNIPLVGAPLGRSLYGGGAVCADPISWFEHGLITAPSSMVLGLNGLGKSSLVRRILLAQAAFGTHAMVLGDIKPDYADVVAALGGQVIDIGHGANGINPLDAGNVKEAARLLGPGQAREKLLASAHERKKTMLASLIQINRRKAPTDREETIIDAAIRVIEDHVDTPVLADVLQVVKDRPEPLRLAALDRGDDARYGQITEDLEASLMALLSGRFGRIFAADKTVPMLMDRSVVFDVHTIPESEHQLQAAVLLACWSYGFATVEIAQTLADAGVAPRQRYQIVMDELWRILRASSGMVDRIDSLTRLNRTVGVGQMMTTHSIVDFSALATREDQLKAQGFVERSKMLFLGGLPAREMELIEGVFQMSQAEKTLLSSWNAPGTYDQSTGRRTPPAGMGRFLLKTSDGPGIPFKVDFVPAEHVLSDTNQRWSVERG